MIKNGGPFRHPVVDQIIKHGEPVWTGCPADIFLRIGWRIEEVLKPALKKMRLESNGAHCLILHFLIREEFVCDTWVDEEKT